MYIEIPKIRTYVNIATCAISRYVYSYTYVHACFRDGHKDKDSYKEPIEYDDLTADATSIQDSPTRVSYAATTQAIGKDINIGPALQYDYARTGPIKVRYLRLQVYSPLKLCTELHVIMYVLYIHMYLYNS